MPMNKDFEDTFPALSKELRNGETQKRRIDGVRHDMPDKSDSEGEEKTFLPDAVDYIRRCDTAAQAREIIEYLVKQGELTASDAREMKRQLKNEGLRSFGSKKEKGHYLRFGLEE
ncbi:DUF2095 domain-containing protein [Candidatus Thorarchaeota archaeon]|nr:MAG: DUF2095 domain-containing protein [Candidatus Thorarchaeota archaeon]